MRYRWQPRTIPAETVEVLHPVALIHRCLVARGFSTAESASEFLDPRLKNLRDPFELPGMQAAVDRLLRAREATEKIVVFGDYDVDGVSATALLVDSLTKLGWCVTSYLPHRMEEGYGLSAGAVANCVKEHGPNLLLAVDCGTSSAAVVDDLNLQGIDCIILDHHQPGAVLPAAKALVNPHVDSSTGKELCATGLAFKLLHALLKVLRGSDETAAALDIREYLDLVALATIADIVPLVAENRILAKAGLARLTQTRRTGLVALKKVARIQDEVGTYEVGFQLGPRLNAAGRLETASLALELLLTRSNSRAQEIAGMLDSINAERQAAEKSILTEVTKLVTGSFNPERDFVIVEGNARWHIGVVGIVASRIQQMFHRPVILAGGAEEGWRGSGRSIEGFDIAAGLRHCSELLVKHGGHAMAAGITIDPANIEAFRMRFNDFARQLIPPEALQPILRIDSAATISEITIPNLRALEALEPFGQGNPSIRLCFEKVKLRCPPVPFGAEGKHLRCQLADITGQCEAIWWNCSSFPGDSNANTFFDIIAEPELNYYNSQVNPRLKLIDCKVSARP